MDGRLNPINMLIFQFISRLWMKPLNFSIMKDSVIFIPLNAYLKLMTFMSLIFKHFLYFNIFKHHNTSQTF